MKQLIPYSGIELEKLRLSQLIKKFHASKLTQHHWDLAIPRNLRSAKGRFETASVGNDAYARRTASSVFYWQLTLKNYYIIVMFCRTVVFILTIQYTQLYRSCILVYIRYYYMSWLFISAIFK